MQHLNWLQGKKLPINCMEIFIHLRIMYCDDIGINLMKRKLIYLKAFRIKTLSICAPRVDAKTMKNKRIGSFMQICLVHI